MRYDMLWYACVKKRLRLWNCGLAWWHATKTCQICHHGSRTDPFPSQPCSCETESCHQPPTQPMASLPYGKGVGFSSFDSIYTVLSLGKIHVVCIYTIYTNLDDKYIARVVAVHNIFDIFSSCPCLLSTVLSRSGLDQSVCWGVE